MSLPLVLPPVATGLMLLWLFGRRGPLGSMLEPLGLEVVFTPAAVVLAMTVMGMPLLVRTARAGFEQVTRRHEQLAETLGAGPWRVFTTITIPLSAKTILAGAILGFSRALGEFGATIVVAGRHPRPHADARGRPLFLHRNRPGPEGAGGAGAVARAGLRGHLGLEPAGARRLMAAFDVSVAISQGSFRLEFAVSCEARALALYGPSGSGKTSVLEVIAGMRRPRRGRVAIGGRVLFDAAAGVDVPTRSRRVGYVPQDALLFPHLDVRRNILYGSLDGDWSSVVPVVERLGIAHLATRAVADLSGGERQRVALARALAARPDILLLDEPLAALDRAMKRVVLQLLVDLRDELRIPMVYVTHVNDEATAITDYAVVLDSGRVSASGPAASVLAEPPDPLR